MASASPIKSLAACVLLLASCGAAAAQSVSDAPTLPDGAAGTAPVQSAATLTQALAALPEPLDPVANSTQQFHLRMFHLHTGESVDVTYRVGNRYVPSALALLNHFLRDHRTGDEVTYDPQEFDVLHALMQKLHKPNGIIDIVCGYRTPWSNAFLRETSFGVAEHSQHMLGKAIDIRVPGVGTRMLDKTALSLGDGGVGYYPGSQFVHVDVGPVRQWALGGGTRTRHGRHRLRASGHHLARVSSLSSR